VKKSYLATLLIVFLGFGPLTYSKEPMTEDRASALVFKYLEKALPARGLSTQCISLLPEETTSKYFEFSVREKHGGKCPGDPEVAPVVDRFRVIKKTGRIQRYDVVNDSWGS